jgi:23S rRNA pseudouridine1911/1915/1917 synthase
MSEESNGRSPNPDPGSVPHRQKHQLPEGHAPVRLDKALVELLGLSRARAKKLLDDDAVRVNGRRSRKGVNVSGGDTIEVVEGAEAVSDPRAPPVPQPELVVRVAYQDASLVVLDKPAGMPSHPLLPDERGTAANFLAAHFPECVQANAEEPREAGLVHRLDVETSGLLAAARTPEAHAALRAAFAARTVDKRYTALCSGPLADEGEIELPLAHAPNDKRKMVALGSSEQAQKLKAREAHTEFKVLARKGDFSLLQVRIDTGVMHQIRVHLSAIGAPIVGDTLYGGPALAGLSRHFLHAARLGVTSPATQQLVQLESPLPQELQSVWDGIPT